MPVGPPTARSARGRASAPPSPSSPPSRSRTGCRRPVCSPSPCGSRRCASSTPRWPRTASTASPSSSRSATRRIAAARTWPSRRPSPGPSAVRGPCRAPPTSSAGSGSGPPDRTGPTGWSSGRRREGARLGPRGWADRGRARGAVSRRWTPEERERFGAGRWPASAPEPFARTIGATVLGGRWCWRSWPGGWSGSPSAPTSCCCWPASSSSSAAGRSPTGPPRSSTGSVWVLLRPLYLVGLTLLELFQIG
jgi:hypothetical protein